MKKILLVVLLSMYCFCANATVFVSGAIAANTTWTKTNSPYIVNGNLSVDSAVTLTIEPGVLVKIDSGCYFRVDGKLVAIGTTVDTIKFTSSKTTPAKKSWSGISFTTKAKADSSTLNYCLFEYGDTTIQNIGTLLKANNSVIRNSNIGIMANGALNFTNVYRCLLTKNNKGMHYSGKSASVTETILSFNDIGLFEETSGLTSGYDSFNYNRVGYWAVAGGLAGFDFNKFKGNSMYGLYLTSSTGMGGIKRICNSVFVYNAKAIGLDSALADYLYENTFAYNDIGIEINFPLSFKFSISNPAVYFGHCFKKNALYNVVNNSAVSISMSACWWGVSGTAGIDSTIYDKNDNPLLGTIDYATPLFTTSCSAIPAPPPCAQLDSVNATVLSSTTASVKWRNVAGIFGYEYYVVPLGKPVPSVLTTVYDTTLSLTGLNIGQVYRICVRAKCGAPPFASAWVCDTIATPCDSPASIHIDHVSTFSAIVSWDTVAGITEYEYAVQSHPSLPPVSGTVTTFNTLYLSGLAPGQTYDICVRSKCPGGLSAWVCDTFRTLSLGVDETSKAPQPYIYPNPNNGVFAIDIPAGMQAGEATVLDVNGRILQRKKYTAGTTLQFDMKDAAKGVYVVRFTTGTTTSHATMVVN